jgi:hypothetical protein
MAPIATIINSQCGHSDAFVSFFCGKKVEAIKRIGKKK